MMPGRAQSAVEYLTTYSWAILIIMLALSLLYFYVIEPSIISPSTCSFPGNLSCQDISIGRNTVTGTYVLTMFITNAQEYPVNSPIISVNLNGTNTSKVACNPMHVPAGGAMFCQIGVSNSLGLNQYVSGKAFLNESYCGLGANVSAISSCTSPITETYVGLFGTHVTNVAISSNVVVTLSTVGSNSVTRNTHLPLLATVTFLGTQIKGVPVNFTESSSVPVLTPQFATTNSSGIARSVITSKSPLTVTITANAFGSIATNTVTFT